MCIIVIQPEGYRMSEEQILDFVERNPHGFGFMWADDSGLHMKKIVSQDPKELVDFYNRHAAGKAGVLHYRFATSGPVNERMAHPFKVSDDLYVVHNGVLPGGNDQESDTAQFVREVLQPYLGHDYKLLYQPDVQAWLDQQVLGSSFVFLDRDGVVTKIGRKGVDWDNCWYSNTYAWTVPPELGGWGSSRSRKKRAGDPRLHAEVPAASYARGGKAWWDEATPPFGVDVPDTDEGEYTGYAGYDPASVLGYLDALSPDEQEQIFEELDDRLHAGEFLSDEELELYIELEDRISKRAKEDDEAYWSDDPEEIDRFLLEQEGKKPKKNPARSTSRGASKKASKKAPKRRRRVA